MSRADVHGFTMPTSSSFSTHSATPGAVYVDVRSSSGGSHQQRKRDQDVDLRLTRASASLESDEDDGDMIASAVSAASSSGGEEANHGTGGLTDSGGDAFDVDETGTFGNSASGDSSGLRPLQSSYTAATHEASEPSARKSLISARQSGRFMMLKSQQNRRSFQSPFLSFAPSSALPSDSSPNGAYIEPIIHHDRRGSTNSGYVGLVGANNNIIRADDDSVKPSDALIIVSRSLLLQHSGESAEYNSDQGSETSTMYSETGASSSTSSTTRFSPVQQQSSSSFNSIAPVPALAKLKPFISSDKSILTSV